MNVSAQNLVFPSGKNILKAFHPPVSILFLILQSYLQFFAVSGVLAPPFLLPRVQGRFNLWYGGLPISLFLSELILLLPCLACFFLYAAYEIVFPLISSSII